MADLTITAANVIADSGAVIVQGTAGEAITAGQVVYLAPTTKRYMKADSNSATAAARSPAGIALNAASNGQPLAVAKSGAVTIGATVTAGTAYYLSDTPGGICPVADVGAGEYSTVLGIASSATVLKVKIQESGVAL